jgi:cytoskeletal protein CcmA (bactofilin family)
MRTRSGLLAALLVLSPGIADATATPDSATGPAASATTLSASSLARDVWSLLQQIAAEARPGEEAPARPAQTRPRVRPQPIQQAGPAGPSVDLSDLSRESVIDATLSSLGRVPEGELRLTVPGGQARLGSFVIGSQESVQGHLLVMRGDAVVHGKLQGNLVAYEGDIIVHPGAVISGDVLALRGAIRDEGGEITGETRTLSATTSPVAAAPPLSAWELTIRRVAGVLGVFAALAALGIGLGAFGRHNLQVVSDTVSHNFGRSFVTGLIGQILLLPTFGMLLVGLFLSVAGILLIPFAVVVYVLLVVVGIVGGYLAVAHAMGEAYTRRRLAQGLHLGAPSSYRFLVAGLAATMALWAAWAIFGWVPVAGSLIRGAAVLVTWLLASAGFGAALLSRAGIRENFAGRIIPPEALTDEYLWATPQFGVPAVRRPGTGSSTGARTPNSGL